ncbi:Ras GTPase-activating protein 4 [Folsomia candida]|uniref:Ras GTPase-activating protein 4 n=1 Tax=Folsomia candida TaxID=158441 RepID=A0A226EER5_FOLCA|nr:Ras GTPase-activating protein 4 [Folsomia candida]
MWKLVGLLCVGFLSVYSSPQRGAKYETASQSRQLREELAQNLYFVLSARNLESHDANHGVADPYVRVHFGSVPQYSQKQGKDLDKVGDSETIVNEANPQWVKVFKVQYIKGLNQKIWVEVRDHDPINPDDVVGEAFIDLDENIPALDEFGGLSDPFVKCYFRYGKEGKDFKFFETPTIDNSDSATWENPITFDNFRRGTDQIFHFVVKDADSITADDVIGEAFMEVEPFADKKQQSVLPLSSSSNATLYVKYILE